MKRSDKIYTLEVDSVELSFGDRTILSSIYLQLQTGVVTAMLGRNGCGKSSLMKIICSQLTPTNISIRLDSTWCMGLSKDQILYLPQHCSIPPYMKILTVFADASWEAGRDGEVVGGHLFRNQRHHTTL